MPCGRTGQSVKGEAVPHVPDALKSVRPRRSRQRSGAALRERAAASDGTRPGDARPPKGLIWKYHADSRDRDLRDTADRTGCHALNPDPDFWENLFPVWAICGPQARAALKPHDVVFFAPDAASSQRAGLEACTCTGWLTVKAVIADGSSLLTDHRFTSRYRRNYRIDLRRHIEADGQSRTAFLRGKNVIVGDPSRSRWLGRRGIPLAVALNAARVRHVRLDVRRIRDLDRDECKRLLVALRPA